MRVDGRCAERAEMFKHIGGSALAGADSDDEGTGCRAAAVEHRCRLIARTDVARANATGVDTAWKGVGVAEKHTELGRRGLDEAEPTRERKFALTFDEIVENGSADFNFRGLPWIPLCSTHNPSRQTDLAMNECVHGELKLPAGAVPDRPSVRNVRG